MQLTFECGKEAGIFIDLSKCNTVQKLLLRYLKVKSVSLSENESSACFLSVCVASVLPFYRR